MGLLQTVRLHCSGYVQSPLGSACTLIKSMTSRRRQQGASSALSSVIPGSI